MFGCVDYTALGRALQGLKPRINPPNRLGLKPRSLRRVLSVSEQQKHPRRLEDVAVVNATIGTFCGNATNAASECRIFTDGRSKSGRAKCDMAGNHTNRLSEHKMRQIRHDHVAFQERKSRVIRQKSPILALVNVVFDH
jgi:hypothetical protein